MKEKDMIQALSNAFGPSGFEDDVIEVAKTYCPSNVTYKKDTMQNFYMYRNQHGDGIKIHLDAHGDEVGFIVQAIAPNGLLRFLPLGGWDLKNIVSNQVLIKNLDGKLIKGIVCSKPPHFMNIDEKGKALDISSLFIDVGATNVQEVEEIFRIGIGAPIVPATKCEYDDTSKLFCGKAFDCRIGCAALLQVLQELEEETIENQISATITAQEEVGERGMMCAIQQIDADLMICFEGCPADDTFQEPYMIQSALKKGPMLRHFDVSMITHPKFQRFALDIAKKYHIPVQESVRKGGGTNGGVSHVHNIPTIVIGIPTRYAHASYGYVSYEDYRHAIELAKCIIKECTKEVYKKIKN